MSAAKFKNLKDFSPQEHDELRQDYFRVSDGYYGLKDLQKRVNNPDLNRLIAALDDVMGDEGPGKFFGKYL